MKLCVIALALVYLAPALTASHAADEWIVRDVAASGGGKAVSVDYQLLHTVGQPVINLVTSTDYIHEQGFWYLPWFFMTPVEEDTPLPKAYRLDQNYPNPFNPTTTISFALTKPSHVSLTLYDPLGREVRTLLDRELEAGEYRVQLDARGLASGLYFYRIRAAGFMKTRKMVILQ